MNHYISQGGLTKRSYFNKNRHVSINDKQALMHSSNVYMFKTALKLAGDPYYSGMALPSDISSPAQKLREVESSRLRCENRYRFTK